MSFLKAIKQRSSLFSHTLQHRFLTHYHVHPVESPLKSRPVWLKNDIPMFVFPHRIIHCIHTNRQDSHSKKSDGTAPTEPGQPNESTNNALLKALQIANRSLEHTHMLYCRHFIDRDMSTDVTLSQRQEFEAQLVMYFRTRRLLAWSLRSDLKTSEHLEVVSRTPLSLNFLEKQKLDNFNAGASKAAQWLWRAKLIQRAVDAASDEEVAGWIEDIAVGLERCLVDEEFPADDIAEWEYLVVALAVSVSSVKIACFTVGMLMSWLVWLAPMEAIELISNEDIKDLILWTL